MHISLAGRLGSGKSTLAKIFCPKYGFEHYYTGAFYKRARYAERKHFFGTLTLSDAISVLICTACCGLIAPKLDSTLSYVLFILVLIIGLFCVASLV